MRQVLACISGLCGSFYLIRRCRRWWRTRRVEGFSAVWPAVADPSNKGTEGAAAFRTLVNFLVRWQEDYLRLAQLAFPLSELELFYSAQRGQCLCWFCSAKGLWEKRKCSHDIKCVYCNQIYHNKVLFWEWKPWASIGAYDTSRPYKEGKIMTCFFFQLLLKTTSLYLSVHFQGWQWKAWWFIREGNNELSPILWCYLS